MAAVSIQFTPSETACWIAAIEASSSCGPQPNDQPPPPTAQAPKPTVVISSPLLPRNRFFSAMLNPSPLTVGASSAQNPHAAFDCGLPCVVTFLLRHSTEERRHNDHRS